MNANTTTQLDTVLVIDDEAGIRTLMTRWVRSIGYQAKAASSAQQALDEMDSEPASVAVCDIRMPGRDGIWLADQLRRRFPDTAVIMATGLRDLDPAVASLRTGAIDYLVKPFGRDQLREAVHRAVEWHRTNVDARYWRRRLEDELRHRQMLLAEAIAEADVTSAGALAALLAMLNTREPAARDHAQRVAMLSVSMALALGVTEPDLSHLERAALLHDLGKIAMPESVLRKPAELSRDEMEIMREYPRIGFDLIKNVSFLQGAAGLVLAATEWFNGQGYPFRLAGSRIPLGSRIIAVADGFDVLTHRRVYRDAMSTIEAVQEVRRCAGTQYDPEVVDAFLKVLGAKEPHSVAVN